MVFIKILCPLKIKFILINLGQYMLVSGKEDSVMDKGQWFGQIMLVMKVSGPTIKRVAKESSTTQMVIFTMENGLIIKQTGLEFTQILRELVMKEPGHKINKMVKVPKHGQKALNMKVTTL